MAHNINTYIGRQAAWHTLGTVTGQFMTWEQIHTKNAQNKLDLAHDALAAIGAEVQTIEQS